MIYSILMFDYYVSIECLYNPPIRHLPVTVGGAVEARHGIILAKTRSPRASASRPARRSDRHDRNARSGTSCRLTLNDICAFHTWRASSTSITPTS